LAPHAIPSHDRPLVVKLHGDALLDPLNTEDETKRLPSRMQIALMEILKARGLIFLGYSANDASVVDALCRLPPEALHSGVYWVNANPPQNPDFLAWLLKRRATWIKQRDFDKTMMALHSELQLPHPTARRFRLLMDSYETAKRLLEKQSGVHDGRISRNTESEIDAILVSVRNLPAAEADKAHDILGSALEKFPRNSRLIGFYAQYMRKIGQIKSALELFEKAIEMDQDNAPNLCHFSSLVLDHPELSQNSAAAREKAESLLRRACASNPVDPLPLGSLASFLWTQYKHHARHEADDLYQRALQADPTNSDTLSGYANFQWRAYESLEDAIEYYQRSIDLNPGNFRTLGNFSQLLFLADDRGRAKRFATTVTRRSNNDVLRLEAYFYLFAHDRSGDTDRYISELKKLVLAGVRSHAVGTNDHGGRDPQRGSGCCTGKKTNLAVAVSGSQFPEDIGGATAPTGDPGLGTST
jgi:tetratricopeptide (TPR) repeat protein